MGGIEAHLAVVPIMGMSRRTEHAGRHGSRNSLLPRPNKSASARPPSLRFLGEDPHRMFFRSRNEKAEASSKQRVPIRIASAGISAKLTFSTNAAAAAVVFSPSGILANAFCRLS